MKLTLMRASGLPVENDQLEDYREEFRQVFDRVDAKCDKDYLRMNRLLARCEQILKKKYTLLHEVELADTEQSWSELIDKMENPILVARKQGAEGIIGVIVDEHGLL